MSRSTFQIPPIGRLDVDTINETVRKIQVQLDELRVEVNNRVIIPEWYVDGECSRKGRMVVVEGQSHTAVALRDTCDPPYIYPVGDYFWASGLDHSLGDAGFVYSSASRKIKRRGQEYRLLDGKYYRVSRIGFLVPHDQNTQSYSIWHEVLDTFDNEWDQTQLIGNFLDTDKGEWKYFNHTAIWEAGDYHRLVLNIVSESAPISFSGYWDQKNTNGNPGEGEMNFQNSETQMRFHKTDENGVDQTAGLEAVVPGATIQRGSTIWNVDDVDIRGSHVRYDISPGGQRGNEDKYTFTFQWGAAADLVNNAIVDHYDPAGNILGYAQNDNDPEIINENQHSLDVYAQEIAVSDDWQIISLS